MKKVITLFVILLCLSGCSSSGISSNNEINYKHLYEQSLQDQPPLIKEIYFDGKVLNEAEACEVRNTAKIMITLEGNCDEVDLFYTPAGSDVYKEQKLIEIVDPNNNIAEYTWNVPENIMGYFNIVAYNKNVGRRSEFYNVISTKSK